MSERRNTIYLRNNIECNSLGFPRFVPKCAQNVPTAPAAGSTCVWTSPAGSAPTAALTRRAILVDAGYVGNELDAAAARELARRLIAAADELAGLEAQR